MRKKIIERDNECIISKNKFESLFWPYLKKIFEVDKKK